MKQTQTELANSIIVYLRKSFDDMSQDDTIRAEDIADMIRNATPDNTEDTCHD